MSLYHYRAKNGPNKVVEGTVIAQDREHAIDMVNAMGYIPISVVERRSQDQAVSLRQAHTPLKIKLRTIVVFSSQLARLLKAGIPILKALSIIAEQEDNPRFKTMIMNMAEDIKSGGTFSRSLVKYPEVFSPLYVSIIRGGEDGGVLGVGIRTYC